MSRRSRLTLIPPNPNTFSQMCVSVFPVSPSHSNSIMRGEEGLPVVSKQSIENIRTFCLYKVVYVNTRTSPIIALSVRFLKAYETEPTYADLTSEMHCATRRARRARGYLCRWIKPSGGELHPYISLRAVHGSIWHYIPLIDSGSSMNWGTRIGMVSIEVCLI